MMNADDRWRTNKTTTTKIIMRTTEHEKRNYLIDSSRPYYQHKSSDVLLKQLQHFHCHPYNDTDNGDVQSDGAQSTYNITLPHWWCMAWC